MNTAPQTIPQLEARLAQLDAERAEVQTALDSARAELAAAHKKAHAEAQRLERDPAERAQLARLTPTLHARLRAAPRNSPTAQGVRDRLPTLDDESVSAADRLTLLRGLLDDLKNHHRLDLETWDAKVPPVLGRELRRKP